MEELNAADLHNRTQEAARILRAQTAEILGQAKCLEEYTQDTPAWYAGTRARLEQAKELVRVLEELGRLRAR
jgi:hypothetical protein